MSQCSLISRFAKGQNATTKIFQEILHRRIVDSSSILRDSTNSKQEAVSEIIAISAGKRVFKAGKVLISPFTIFQSLLQVKYFYIPASGIHYDRKTKHEVLSQEFAHLEPVSNLSIELEINASDIFVFRIKCGYFIKDRCFTKSRTIKLLLRWGLTDLVLFPASFFRSLLTDLP